MNELTASKQPQTSSVWNLYKIMKCESQKINQHNWTNVDSNDVKLVENKYELCAKYH